MESKNKDLINTPCICVLGTGSDVGKSIIVTALCRLFADKGLRTVPYKAQNMSNNSGVTPEGLEMGRAQIVQAEAARVAPHVDMNPVLLKPTSDVGSQVVLLGKAVENSTAVEYHKKKESLFDTACDALDRLRARSELVVMEGAGSCAEVNLMPTDIVNFRIAEYAQAPVILVADIHRGGVFAQLVGTLECIPPACRDRIKGFIINRFRGDIRLFEDGVRWIEAKTGKPVLGVLPWYSHITIEAEDSVVIENPSQAGGDRVTDPAIAVIRIPHISNFTDFDPLTTINGLQVHFIEKVQSLSAFRAVILPGSKNTRYDLNWMHRTGWTRQLQDFHDRGGHILGICGGYQMMGAAVHDPHGLEGGPGTTQGLSLLSADTVLKAPKTTTCACFSWNGIQGRGYEIHMGETICRGGSPLFSIHERNGETVHVSDGCTSSDGRAMGTYIHGLFDTPEVTRRWLDSIGIQNLNVSQQHGPAARNAQYDLLAAHVEKHIDVRRIETEWVRSNRS